jgi:hypothetical protein
MTEVIDEFDGLILQISAALGGPCVFVHRGHFDRIFAWGKCHTARLGSALAGTRQANHPCLSGVCNDGWTYVSGVALDCCRGRLLGDNSGGRLSVSVSHQIG